MLKQFRLDRGISREELSARSKLAVEYIRGLENGHFPVSDSALVRLSRGFGVTVETLEQKLKS